MPYRVEWRKVEKLPGFRFPTPGEWKPANLRVHDTKMQAYQELCGLLGAVPVQAMDGYGAFYYGLRDDLGVGPNVLHQMHYRIVQAPAEEHHDHEPERQITL